jgi:hypothetical protein
MNKEDGEFFFSFYSFSNGKDGEMDNIKPRCHIGKINSTLSTQSFSTNL